LAVNIQLLPHPSNSPDLNPIEHIWDMIGRRLRNLERPPANLQELERALHEIWHEIPQNSIRTCINIQERFNANAIFVKNARITSRWHYSVKKNRRDSNFFSNCFVEKYILR